MSNGIPKNATPEQRKALIEQEVKKRKEEQKTNVKADVAKFNGQAKPTTVKVAATPKKEETPVDKGWTTDKDIKGMKPAPSDDMLTVSDIARELKLDPKVARGKLRRHGFKGTHRATEGRWPKVKRDSAEHKELVAIITAKEDDEEKRAANADAKQTKKLAGDDA